ncbi:MAG: tsaB [Gammaproteobacteria bacterium]|jgi:tRNA threonylcarbamoyladenosine biosynthesis protein TsaB|nr:tsaB [Gammaproteobacteria bacterium]
MKILALDTSSTACSVALLLDDNISYLHRVLPSQQAQFILPMLKELLAINKINLNQLNAISFGCGPGSFTGVRLAASVTQGLAYGLEACGLEEFPVIPISSLAALAQAAYHDLGWKKLLVGVDARIQEVYWGAYKVNEQGYVELINTEIVCPPAQVILPEEKNWYGVGNAWEIYAGQIAYEPPEIDATRLPMAAALLELAKIDYLKKKWVSAKEALPVYLRDTVTKE